MRSFPVDTRSQPDPLITERICPIASMLQKRVSYSLPLVVGGHYQSLNLGISLACQQSDAVDLAKANKSPVHLGDKPFLMRPLAQRSQSRLHLIGSGAVAQIGE